MNYTIRTAALMWVVILAALAGQSLIAALVVGVMLVDAAGLAHV